MRVAQSRDVAERLVATSGSAIEGERSPCVVWAGRGGDGGLGGRPQRVRGHGSGLGNSDRTGFVRAGALSRARHACLANDAGTKSDGHVG